MRILLPAGYASHPRAPLPGALPAPRRERRPDLLDQPQGEAEQLTAKLPLIVVMPDGGRGGFYTNWFNNGEGGCPRWEDWHIKRLIP